MAILYAFLILAILAVFLGTGLVIADKKLAIQIDEKLQLLQEGMPGANCGGCGFAGCSAYAEAVYSGKAKPGLCAPGGQELADKMGSIMGIAVEKQQRMAAFVFCKGSCDSVVKDYDYKGLKDCNAASILFKGDNACKFGCLHLGSCIKVCDEHAIYRTEDGNIEVNRDKCIACGKCVKICPNSVIKLIPYDAKYAVACNSHDSGAVVRKNCEIGCIGCKICEVKFPESGFKVDSFLASSDYSTANESSDSACEACPRKIIVKL